MPCINVFSDFYVSCHYHCYTVVSPVSDSIFLVAHENSSPNHKFTSFTTKETISISVSCSRCYLYIFLFSWMQVNPNDIDWNWKEFDNYGNCPPPYKLKWFHSNKGLNLINDVYVIKTINCNSTWIWHPFCMWYFAFLLRRHARGPRRLDGRPHTGSC